MSVTCREYLHDVDVGPNVFVRSLSFWHDDDAVCVAYRGRMTALVAAGIATTDMLLPGKKGRPKFDSDGDRYTVQRHRGGTMTVQFFGKPIKHALSMPGFAIAPLLDRFRRPPTKA